MIAPQIRLWQNHDRAWSRWAARSVERESKSFAATDAHVGARAIEHPYSMHSGLQAFAAEARNYCAWALSIEEGDQGAATALRRIVALYQAALRLPPCGVEGTRDDPLDFGTDERELVRAACARLPLQYYSEQFDPLAISSTEEPTIGDIADDIADIFRDVRNGLWYFDTGRLPDAAWEWAFGFQSHWGRHAAGAIRILHAYLAEHCRERLVDDVER